MRAARGDAGLRARPSVAGLAAVAASALAACGDAPSASHYCGQMRTLSEDYRARVERSRPQLKDNVLEVGPAFDARERALRDYSEAVGDLDPPDELEQPHDEYARALEQFGEEFRPVADAVRKGDFKRFDELSLRGWPTPPTSDALRRSHQELVRRGCDAGPSILEEPS